MANIVPVTLPLVPDLSQGLLSFTQQIQQMYTTLMQALSGGQWGTNPYYFKSWLLNHTFPGQTTGNWRLNVGFGFLSSLNPTQTGRQLVVLTGWATFANGATAGFTLAKGTGTPPALGTHPPVGIGIDGIVLTNQDTVASQGTHPFQLAGIAMVTPGVVNWYDLIMNQNTTNQAFTINNGNILIVDV